MYNPDAPWECDPTLLRVGRRFRTTWLMGSGFDAADCYTYEVYESGKYGFADEHPAYVGITRDFPSRWGEHRRSSWWFDLAKPLCIILNGYPSRADALKVEALLIEEHQPMFNTKPERRHLHWAIHEPPRRSLFTAELTLRGAS